jgi:hypothetical protein
MRSSAFTVALGAAATIAALAACSGYQPTTGPSLGQYQPMTGSDGARSVLPAGFKPHTTRPSWMKPAPPGADARKPYHIAVAQFGGSSVLWFPLNDKTNKPPTVCQPASSTNGIAIDRGGNLWVPDGRANTTTEYGPNCGAAKLTIPDTTGEPADVGFSGNKRVYILNLNNTSGAPTVGVYNKNNGKQLGTLSDPSFAVLFGIGSDREGNVFVSNLESNNVANVVEFPKGKMPGHAALRREPRPARRPDVRSPQQPDHHRLAGRDDRRVCTALQRIGDDRTADGILDLVQAGPQGKRALLRRCG